MPSYQVRGGGVVMTIFEVTAIAEIVKNQALTLSPTPRFEYRVDQADC